jgi:excisionase family DNA binding protein
MTAWITPVELAKRWGVGHAKVLAWIDSGELGAVNVATSTNSRPQYRIMNEEAERFLAARSTAIASEETQTSEG